MGDNVLVSGFRNPRMNPTARDERAPLVWSRVLMFVLTFAVAVIVVPWYGFTYGFSAAAWVWFAVLLYANGLAITTGYHRLWSHQTFDAHWSRALRVCSSARWRCRTASCSGPRTTAAITSSWTTTSATPTPPAAGSGSRISAGCSAAIRAATADLSTVRDLEKDPILAFQHRFYLPIALGMNVLLPLALGWLHGDLWGVFLLAGVLRLVVSHHFTFLINSAAHAFGRQPYSDEHSARDNGWLAFLTYGEGYHNFHHQFAHDYRNGIRWWQWDPSKWIIFSLSWVGLTTRLRRTPRWSSSVRASPCSSAACRRTCSSAGPVAAARRHRADPRDGRP